MTSRNGPLPAVVAKMFAQALDHDDFQSAGELISPDCVYHARNGLLVGRAAICASYSEASAWAKANFDLVEYESLVHPPVGQEVVITFIDHITREGKHHAYSCRQSVQVTHLGTINRIHHQELPGQREAVLAFMRLFGIQRS